MSTEKEMRQKYFDAFEDLIASKPFLLENHREFIPMEEYLTYFHKMNDYKKFGVFAFPWAYSTEILDKLKDRIVWSCSLMAPEGNRRFTSLVQLSPQTHIQFTTAYLQEEERMAAFAEVWTTKPGEASDFYKTYKDMIIRNETKPVFGFTQK